MRSLQHPPPHAGKAARGLRPGGFGLGLGQCRLRQDPCAGAARHAAAAGGVAPCENPLPHLHQGRGRQYGEAGVRYAGAVDAARRRGARAAIVATGAPEPTPRDRVAGAKTLRAHASRRRAASRCRPSTPFASGCCISFRSRPMSPARFEVLDESRRRNCWSGRAATFCSRPRADPGASPPRLDRVDAGGLGADFEALHQRGDRQTRAFAAADAMAAGISRRRAARALGLAPGRRRRRHRRRDDRGAASARRAGARSPTFLATGIANGPDEGASCCGGGGSSRRGDLDACLEAYLSIFFTEDGDARKNVLTKALATRHPDLERRSHAEQDASRSACVRAKGARRWSERRALVDARSTRCSTRYDAMQGRARAARFRRPDRQDAGAARTLGRAPGCSTSSIAGIDHVLVDEAQDTSAPQWRHRGAADRAISRRRRRARAARTFFAVGDEKQSIFSFQGAAPRYVRRDAAGVRNRLSGRRRELRRDVRLTHSFRSAPGVLVGRRQGVSRPADHQSGLVAEMRCLDAARGLEGQASGPRRNLAPGRTQGGRGCRRLAAAARHSRRNGPRERRRAPRRAEDRDAP